MVGTRLAALLLLVAAPAVSQSVRGQLTDSITKAPIPGAFLTLVNDQGFELTRTMTNNKGEFLLTAPAPGSYRLRSKRIGFRPYVSTALDLRAGSPLSFNVAIDPIPVALSSVVIEGEQRCDIAAGGTGSVSAVWEEVREALAAVSWTSRLPNYWYDISHFQRDVSSSGRRQAGRPDSTWREIGYQRVPIKSVPAEDLEINGFVLAENDSTTYRGPDAEVMMSGPFLRTHCFVTRTGKDENEGLIGLAFTPVRGRRLSDIQGTLWIDKTTAELRELNYTYTHLSDDLVAPRAGGHIEFVRLPSGTWIVSNWVIRMPIAVQRQRAMAMGTQLQLVGYIETGGDLVEVKTRSGTIVYRGDSVAVALATMTPASSAAAASAEPAPSLPTAPANGDEPAVAAPAPPARASARNSNSNVIAQDEVESSSATDAYALIQELRPMWMRSRGQISIHDPSSGNVQVYLHGERYGEVASLRDISKREIREIRFYNPAQAEMKFGAGNAGGVINVELGVTTPVTAIAANPPPAAPPPPPPPEAAPPDAGTVDTAAPTPTLTATPTQINVNRRRLALNQNLLTPEEFEGTTMGDVFSLIQHYRPNWLLRNRGPVSIYNPTAGDTRVYYNGVSVGDLSRLHDYRVEDVRELRLLSAGEAQQRYGSGNAGGVIEIWTK